MTSTRWKLAAALVLAVGLLGGGAWLARPTASAEPAAPKAEADRKPAPKAGKPKGKRSAYRYILDEIDLPGSRIKVHVHGGGKFTARGLPYEFDVTRDTRIVIDNEEARLADLVVGIPVTLTIDRDTPARPGTLGTVTQVEATGEVLYGTLTEVDPANSAVRLRYAGSNEGLDVADAARIVIDGRTSKLSRLKPGMGVGLRMSAVRPVAVEITTIAPQFQGSVEEVNTKKLTLTLTTNGEGVPRGRGTRRPGTGMGLPQDTFAVDPDVRVTIRGKAAKLSDLKPDMTVQVELTADPDESRILTIRVEE
jgi:hypothetical protein